MGDWREKAERFKRPAMSDTASAITPEVVEQHGLSPEEYERVLNAEPEWTTWKKRTGFKAGEVQHTIDYIFVSPEIDVGRVLLPPDQVTRASTNQTKPNL